MFESAELGHTIEKATFDKEVPALRAALLEAQSQVIERAQFPVVIVLHGLEGAGKGETLQVLHDWLDSRHIETHAMSAPNCVDEAHPPMWRHWQALPPKGKMGIFFGAWYRDPLAGRALGREKRASFVRSMDEIIRFETMLTDEGALVLKFWLHISKKAQAKRLRELEKDKLTWWRVKKSDWRDHERYDRFYKSAEEMLRLTSTRHSPWVTVEGTDSRYRHLTVARVLLDAMRGRLEAPKKVHTRAPPFIAALDNTALLRSLNLSMKLDKKDEDEALLECQARLNAMSRRLPRKRLAVIAVFEGQDAAGKGGAIRRVTRALDARHYRVIPFAAPTDEERAHPYLWRFWRQVPEHGKIALFDRSWYGRVLVERVEGFAAESDWMRAYSEINDFEAQLAEHGVVLAKFYLVISKREQLRRFKDRETGIYKRYKLTGEDWRNRGKWDAYLQAAADMVDRTSTEIAPWTLVEADDKPFARVKVLRTLIDRIEAGLG